MTAKRQLSDQVLGAIKGRSAKPSKPPQKKAGLTTREAEINGLVQPTPKEIALVEETGSGSLHP
jgi:hypothetical protein